MRNTIAKAKILELINHSEVALSHSEIEKLTEGLCNRVTIYRVLDRLTDEGHIHRFINIDGHQKFAACHHCDAHHHHNHAHFSCTQCGTVSCLEDVEPVYKLPKEYKVQDMNFVLSGVCPRCVK